MKDVFRYLSTFSGQISSPCLCSENLDVFCLFFSWEYAVSGMNASNILGMRELQDVRGSLSSTCAVVGIAGEPGGKTCRHLGEGNLPN